MADLRVLVVDDQPLMAYALKAYIDAAEGMTTVAVAEDGQQALDAVAALAPDVVLMDLQMPVLDGVQATRAISRSLNPSRSAVTNFSTVSSSPDQTVAESSGDNLRVTLEADLRQACEQEQLGLVYQPQINVQSGRVVGFEALMRWRHPRRGG